MTRHRSASGTDAAGGTDAGGGRRGSAGRSLRVPDRLAYALFASRADGRRHERDRRVYRGTNLGVPFDLYVARVHAAAWALAALGFVAAVAVGTALPADVVASLADRLLRRLGGLRGPIGAPPTPTRLTGGTVAAVAVGVGALVAAGIRAGVVYLGSRYLRWLSAARRSDIARTLPGAVRYLHVLASGSDGRRAMLRRVADTDAYGETGSAPAADGTVASSQTNRRRRWRSGGVVGVWSGSQNDRL